MTGPLDMSQDPDRYDPERDAATGPGSALPPPGAPLDMSQDPDRFDAVRDVGLTPVERAATPRLDPDADPDRYRPGAGSRRVDPTLNDLLGGSAGDDDEPRDTYTWFVGLLGVLAFLGLVALLFGRVLSPG